MAKMDFFDPPPIRWTGSKWQLADWLISMFPPHICYVEPYCGGASVFFRKYPSRIEVLNDLDSSIVNFFKVLRTRANELIDAIDMTPYAREEYDLAFEPTEDELERARRFYVATRQSFHGMLERKTGWRTQKHNKRGTMLTGEWARLEGLYMAAQRLKSAQIEHDSAVRIIERYDTDQTLFYIDPPYVLSARSDDNRKRYAFEMTDDEHRELAGVLHSIEGMVVLSGYDSPLYRELYEDWHVVSKSTTTNGNGAATEYVWINQAAQKTALFELQTVRI